MSDRLPYVIRYDATGEPYRVFTEGMAEVEDWPEDDVPEVKAPDMSGPQIGGF